MTSPLNPSSLTTPVISVAGVAKSYRRGGQETPVLQSIDLAVAPGECVFLAGPSGSGKTTLLSILGCILTPDAGSVKLLGDEVSTLSNRQRTLLRRDRIGFVFQKFHLIRGLTALDNVCVPLQLRGENMRLARRRGMELLGAVGLADKASSYPKNLSTGQCQRVALARALAVDPDIILADEPTASLDAASGREAMGLLRRLTTEFHKTAIVVTHDPRIFHFADRVCHMDSGRLIHEYAPEALEVDG
ncbi:MAG TPA: ABC transporter ATP-binding protein [Pirellulaceae bacterium]|nr:ABC transporter ATP-binding protein [Pirellulaceae bacterium]